MDHRELKKALEVLLFVHHQPISVKDFLGILGEQARKDEVEDTLEEIRRELALADKPYSLEAISGGWQLLTRPEHDALIQKLGEVKKHECLTRPQLETLAVVAYAQPATRGEVESIRGVGCGPVMKTLLERGYIQAVGKAEALGAPVLYATSKRFLEAFGMKELKELPEREEILQDFRRRLKRARADSPETGQTMEATADAQA